MPGPSEGGGSGPAFLSTRVTTLAAQWEHDRRRGTHDSWVWGRCGVTINAGRVASRNVRRSTGCATACGEVGSSRNSARANPVCVKGILGARGGGFSSLDNWRPAAGPRDATSNTRASASNPHSGHSGAARTVSLDLTLGAGKAPSESLGEVSVWEGIDGWSTSVCRAAWAGLSRPKRTCFESSPRRRGAYRHEPVREDDQPVQPVEPRAAWSASAGAAVYSAQEVANALAYVSSRDGKLQCLPPALTTRQPAATGPTRSAAPQVVVRLQPVGAAYLSPSRSSRLR